MFCIDIIDHDGQMAITVAQIVRLGAALVDRQLHFEIGFGIAQIDQREGFEIDALGNIEAKGPVVEGNGFFLVENTDHRMNGFGHMLLLFLSPLRQMRLAIVLLVVDYGRKNHGVVAIGYHSQFRALNEWRNPCARFSPSRTRKATGRSIAPCA